MKKIIWVVVILILIGGGVWYFNLSNTEDEYEDIFVPRDKDLNTDTTESAKETANDDLPITTTRTYTSNALGISLDYPSADYAVDERGCGFGDSKCIRIYPTPPAIEFGPVFYISAPRKIDLQNTNLENEIGDRFGDSLLKTENVSINNKIWIKADIEDSYFERVIDFYYFTQIDDYYYMVLYRKDDARYLNNFTSIFQSLKFDQKPVVFSHNTETSKISDEDFIKMTSDPQGKVLARGDIDLDGYEDAIVQEMSCGASCSFNLAIVFSDKDNSLRLFTPSEYANFEPAYRGSSAVKSSVTDVSIENGVISLTGKGLDCPEVCTIEKWNIIRTIEYTINDKKLVRIVN